MSRALPERLAERLPEVAALFATNGFENTSVADIATATGVPRATLYYHFDDKQAMLAHLLGRLLDRFATAITDATESAGGACEQLRQIVGAIVSVIADEPDACLLLLTDLARAGRLPEIAGRIDHVFHRPLRRVLRDGVAQGSIRAVDIEHTAAAVFGAVVFAALQRPSTGRPVETERVIEAVTGLLVGGLQLPTTQAQQPACRSPHRPRHDR